MAASTHLHEAWPALPLAEWQDTRSTLHLWTQMVGKIRLACVPLVNHWWNVPLYVTARGLTTTAMPYEARSFQIDFDFIDHQLLIQCSDGARRTLKLEPRSVADFYQELLHQLAELGLYVKIWKVPVEIDDPIPFDQDHEHASYDPEYAHRFWRALSQAGRVLEVFRGRFLGKCSPVHFFWGSFDLAVTRFSGRRAPARDGADRITREAYSHEVISHGFWPGVGDQDAAFYAYAAPSPQGLAGFHVHPKEAYFNDALGEFLLPYEAVRTAANPDHKLLSFLQSTYEAGAMLARWDRTALERLE
ncbi:DUF5996 family protein [Hymenobacter persicinus]|uniref:Ava_C0101 and related proteins n=1 Tax=Hymenobacter persicinus TaxID=2025506 RepID=A0A4Q5LE78_9BACT|nr:DUF5996 family protein [Hymenobacter persicinus]RYU82446.1 hypothetical protein EWM57_04495 [Hymenobacter persicinus]